MSLIGFAVAVALQLAPGPEAWPGEMRDTLDALQAVPADPAPAQVTNGVHYLTSNERRLDLFLPELSHRGGVHLGVGSDQNYILAGWSRPELMVVVDFDQSVVDMHTIYGSLFASAETPQRFVELWSEDGSADAKQAIRDAVPRGLKRKRLVDLYTQARRDVAKRTKVLLRKYDDLGVHWYLEDQAQYDAVRTLAVGGKVIAVRGDFTVEGVLQDVGELLHDADRPVHTLYLSNIEQYFMYTKTYRANMLGLPFDDKTLVLRTLPGRPAGFQYMLQQGENFRAWLQAKRVYSVYRVRGMVKGEHLEASEKFIIDELP
ncbi:MAG: hypothetical protein AAF721_10495 [Myxococcota bacterium]